MRAGYALKRLQDFLRAGLMLRKLEARERWTPQDLETFQRQQLSALVTYAVQHSPFYQELYKERNIREPIVLSDLPTIDKATLMENFDGLVTDRRLKLAELQAHLRQLTRDDYYLGQYRVLTTSGSSGTKGVFVFTRNEWSTVLAASFRAGLTMDIHQRFPNRWRISWIVADNPAHVSHCIVASTDFGHVKMQHLYATSRMESLVASLNSFRPEVLVTYPSIASLLATEQLEGHLTINPKVVETGGEIRTNEMARTIREAWGIIPFNLYGTTECGAINVDCSFHRGIHLFEDMFIAEVVDEQNRPVPDGSPGRKVLLTNLFNRTQPLIRYEVSDMLTMSTEACPCGRPFRLISAVEGRSDDIIYFMSPNGKDVPVHPIHFYDAMEAFPEIKEYQVVHEDDEINVGVVLRGGACQEGVTRRLTENLRAALASLGVTCPNIGVRFVDRIERDPSTMNKLKLVTSLNSPSKSKK